MEYTKEQAQKLQAEFHVRWKWQVARQVLAGVAALLIIGPQALDFPESVLGIPVSETVVFVIGMAILILISVSSLLHWRCPGCKKWLGQWLGPDICPKCGLLLKPPRSTPTLSIR